MTRACGFFNGSGAIYESGEARPGPFPAPTINCGRAGGRADEEVWESCVGLFGKARQSKQLTHEQG